MKEVHFSCQMVQAVLILIQLTLMQFVAMYRNTYARYYKDQWYLTHYVILSFTNYHIMD